MSQTPAGWYPDANGTTRWWDGAQWTEHTQPPAAPAGQVEQPAVPSPDPSAPSESPSESPVESPAEDRTVIRRPFEDPSAAAPTAPYPTSAPPSQPPGQSAQSGQSGRWSAGHLPPQYGQYPAAQQYAAAQYPGQEQYPGYGQWPGTTTPKRTIPIWLVVTIGAVVLLVIVGLVLLFTLRGGDDKTASSQDFCSALDALPNDASLSDATAAIKATGLPSDIPAAAKHGFELYVQFAPQLDNAHSMADPEIAQIVGGAANVSDMNAFDSYVDQTCGTAAR